MQEAGPVANGAKGSIGTSAVALTATSQQLNRGIYLQALGTNNAVVYVGAAGVTAANGYPIAIGGITPLIPCSDPSQVFVVAASGTQEVRWIGG